MRSSKPTWRTLAAATAAATIAGMLAGGCGASDDQFVSAQPAATTTAEPTTTTPPASAATPTQTVTSGAALWQRALDGEFDGTQVELAVYEYDPSLYFEMADALESETGIRLNVTVEPSDDMMMARLFSGDDVDIAAVPPSDAWELATYEVILDVRPTLGESWLEEQYDQKWLDIATIPTASGEVMAGVMHRFWMGNVIFYPADDFETASYAVPRTWGEMMSLSELIINEGGTPWCIGIEAGDYTGWMITSWLEDILLRTAPGDVHERWTFDQLDFDSPQLAGALNVLSEIWLADGFVAGGRAAISRTDTGQSVLPMFEEPPGCWFHLQSPWIEDSFPDGAQYGRDYDFFLVPPIDEELGTPMAIASTMMVMLNDRPEVQAVMAYLAQPESVAPWAGTDQSYSAHAGTPADAYPSPLSRALAAAMADVDTVRPSAMNAAAATTVRSKETRRLLTEYVDGQRSAGEVLTFIDNPSEAPPPPPPIPPRTANIVDLIAEGAVRAAPRGAGIDDLELDLENLLDELLDVEIPPGTYFVAGSGGVQNMVVRTGKTVTLKPGELLKAVLDVACANREKDIPEGNDNFTVKRERSSEMTQLMQVLNEADARYDIAQAATWIVSDNANYNDLGILISSPSRARVIDRGDAAAAMQLVDAAGVDITGRRIWRDRTTIAEGADAAFQQWLAER